MNYYLFLDDCRFPHKVDWVELPLVEWVIARNYEDFTKLILKLGLPKFIAFDHDLSPSHYELGANSNFKEFDYSLAKEKTGFHCAQFLIDYCIKNKLKLPKWIVHSMNPCGKKNIESLLSGYEKFSTIE